MDIREPTDLSGDIEKLESLFSSFNGRFFQDALQKPVITASSRGRRTCTGWCTGWKAWDDTRTDESSLPDSGRYEINICSEYLDRPFEDICETLLHEMVHLYHLQLGIKDTSRSGLYHNKRFKMAAEEHGLLVSKDKTYGFCFTSLNPDAKAFVASLDGSAFKLYRRERPATSQKDDIGTKNIKKARSAPKDFALEYRCPKCKLAIRTSGEVRLLCMKCGVELLDYYATFVKSLNIKIVRNGG